MAIAFAQETAEAASAQWRRFTEQLRPTVPRLSAFMDHREDDVLAYTSFPLQYRAKLRSTDKIDKAFG